MLKRSFLSLVIAGSLLNTQPAKAELMTIAGWALAAAAGGGIIAGCKLFLDHARGPKPQEYLERQIAAMTMASDTIKLKIRGTGDKLRVVPEQVPGIFKLAFNTEQDYHVSFNGLGVNPHSVEKAIQKAKDFLIGDLGYTPVLDIGYEVDESNIFRVTVKNARDMDELVRTYLTVVKELAMIVDLDN